MTAGRILFAPFVLDSGNQRLWKGEKAIELRPKAFAVLQRLAERPGQLITKEDLLDAVWPGVSVSDTVLKVCIREIREALGDDVEAPRYIETAHRRGYRFIAESATAVEPSGAAETLRLFGREEDLARLRRCLEKALRGERQIVFVGGEPGIGKTALVDAFLEHTTTDPAIWHARGQCVEHYGASEPYLPILDAITRLCRDPGHARFVSLLRQLAPTWVAQLPALRQAADGKAKRELREATPARMLREIAEALDALTAKTPLVLVLEDLHWSDFSTADLISTLGRRQEPARLMLICTHRPLDRMGEEHPLRAVQQELRQHRQCEVLSLDFLGEEAIAEYLVARRPHLPAALARSIHLRTKGNPLFLVTLVDDLVARGGLDSIDYPRGLQRLTEEIETALPADLREMIERQFERLGNEDRKLLEVASVVGAEFDAAVVAAAMRQDVLEVEERCLGLVRAKQFLQPAGSPQSGESRSIGYAFVHALYQTALYERLGPTSRSDLHRRIGEHLEAAEARERGESAAELAMHFDRGGDPRRAIQHLHRAVEGAVRRGAYREAEKLSRRALQLLDNLRTGSPDSREVADLAVATYSQILAVNWRLGGSEAEAADLFAEGLEFTKAVGEPSAVAKLLANYALIRNSAAGAAHDFLAYVQQALLEAERTSDSGLVFSLKGALAFAYYVRGRYRDGLAHCDRMLADKSRDMTRDARVMGFSSDLGLQFIRCCFLGQAGGVAQGTADLERFIELARESEETLLVGWGHAAVGLLAELSADPDAEQFARQAIEIADRIGVPFSRSQGFLALGIAQLVNGSFGKAATSLEEALRTVHATRSGLHWEPHIRAYLAEAYLESGDLERARATADEAINVARRCHTLVYELRAHLARAHVLLADAGAKVAPEIDAALNRAASVVEETGATSYAPFVHEARSRLAALRGDGATRLTELREAHRLFEDIGAKRHAERSVEELAAARRGAFGEV
jgi:DNA-binding winged helix-turn-helix (wHTH) protein